MRYLLSLLCLVIFTGFTIAQDAEKIHESVDQMPRFPGCEQMKANEQAKKECADNKMLQFLYKRLRYPAEARENGVEGMCVVEFIIEKDGSLSNLKLVRDIGAGCGEASLATVQAMNDEGIKWTPGKQDGVVQRVSYILPLKFKLESSPSKMRRKNASDGLNLKRHQEHGTSVKPPPPPPPPTAEQLTKTQRGHYREGSAPPPPPPPPPMEEEEVFKVVEDMPRFPGCESEELGKREIAECAANKMRHFIYDNLTYPEGARKEKIEGTVVVQFVVEKDGSLNELKILRDIGGGCGQAAKDVIKLMNSMPESWIAGEQRGRKVRVYYTMPIKFNLERHAQGYK